MSQSSMVDIFSAKLDASDKIWQNSHLIDFYKIDFLCIGVVLSFMPFYFDLWFYFRGV